MIIVTGGLGFIGSNLIKKLNKEGYHDIIIIENTLSYDKISKNNDLIYIKIIKTWEMSDFLIKNHPYVDVIFHLGAKTDTISNEYQDIYELNLNFSLKILNQCMEYSIPILYASTAATYGDGKLGFNDYTHPNELKPLNPYGESKNIFDKYVLKRLDNLDYCFGFKFFNVYGYGEKHKDKMASVIYHGYNQISRDGIIKLFKSGNHDYKDGEQIRDFIYVKDIVNVLYWFFKNNKNSKSGIYNLGTGNGRTFNELAESLINAMGVGEIEYVDMLSSLKDRYQYETQARMKKLRIEGNCYYKFMCLEDGVYDYVSELNQVKRK
jgi:ADP-L-glycero-D-manno-heptose 6-epimerase